jgi:PIN domain nuclease of toxin-antitoxin system
MTLLLDTHVLLWWLADHRELSKRVRADIAAAPRVYVSAVSIWEIVVKQAVGKLQAPNELVATTLASGFEPLPVTLEHAERVAELPRHHADPFDRMLVAQALVERLTIVSRDERISAYEVSVLPWR